MVKSCANIVITRPTERMDQTYRDATGKMEELGIDPEYILGWQGGYLGHPEREEQRISEAYKAGYQDGQARETGNFENWKLTTVR